MTDGRERWPAVLEALVEPAVCERELQVAEGFSPTAVESHILPAASGDKGGIWASEDLIAWACT